MQDTDPTTCAEAALDGLSSSDLFRYLIEQSGQGFLVLGGDLRVAYANARLADMLGYAAAAEMLALSSCLDMFALEDADELRPALEAHMVGERQVRARRADGSTVWVDVRVFQLPWHGQPAVSMIVTDASAQKHLEGVAADLDRQLTHLDRLRTVYEMGAELMHEVAQPLSALQGYATAIEQAYAHDTATPERVLNLVAKIRRCGDNVRKTALRIRNYGRRAAGSDPNSEPADGAAAIRDAVEISMRSIRSRNPNVRVALSLPPDLPGIGVDPVELQQVVINLVHNAASALPGDAPEGTRILVRADRHGGRLVLEVADTGAGMNEDVLSHIFDPFFTTKADGMGLGLPICRRIVQGWGGELQASSTPGHGTTMCFDLPFATAPAAGG